jgi:hypothetical protein
MSHRSKQAAVGRRSRRADQQQQAPARPTIVSNNPIFFSGAGHDDVPAAVGKPLPLPPSRMQAQMPPARSRAGTALVMSRRGSGWVLSRVPRADPFLAAYVACTKDSGGKVDAGAAPVKRQQRKNKTRGNAVQGCGIWSGWAAGAKYAGAMSCKYGCDVVAGQGGGRASAAAAQASPEPRLHLSRQLVVIPARKRALVRGSPQG